MPKCKKPANPCNPKYCHWKCFEKISESVWNDLLSCAADHDMSGSAPIANLEALRKVLRSSKVGQTEKELTRWIIDESGREQKRHRRFSKAIREVLKIAR